MEEVHFTKRNVSSALNTLADWFPEEAEDIRLYKAELVELIVTRSVPGKDSPIAQMRYKRPPMAPVSRKTEEPLFTPCESAIAAAVANAGIFVVGIIGLRVTYSTNVARAMQRTMGAKTLNGFRTMFKTFSDSKDKFEAAKGLFTIAGSIWQGGGFKIILEAWKKEAKWYDFILAGVTMIAQLVIWFASDGVAFVAQVALTILSAVTLGRSIYDAVNTCTGSASPEFEATTFTPLGTYHRTSTGIKVLLTARCKDFQQKERSVELNITNLPLNTVFENVNGELINRGEEVLFAQKFTPLGSYVKTSKAIKVMLYANCEDARGTEVTSQLDITNFSTSQPILNQNGVLKKGR
jgi:hypothetical protein